jgi:hypothetical protein
MEQIGKVMKENTDQEKQKESIEKLLEDFSNDLDLKYFILINGIFDKTIYRQLKSRIPIIKHLLLKESNDVKDEAVYHVIGAIADLTTNRYKDLGKYIPSILYYFYIDDIITEEFYIKYAIKGNLPLYNSKIYTRELEAKFLEHSKDFTYWME